MGTLHAAWGAGQARWRRLAAMTIAAAHMVPLLLLLALNLRLGASSKLRLAAVTAGGARMVRQHAKQLGQVNGGELNF